MAAAAISHFENGVRAPSLDSLIRLADALDITTDELLGRVAYATSRVDPLFLRAAQSDARTYDVLKRVTEALLDAQASANAQSRSPEPPPAPGAA